MAWRPTEHLIDGELDNTTPGQVTGWMRFAGMNEKVTFDLKGNFHRDIRGAKIRLTGDGREDDPEAASYMDGMATRQTGDVGDITAGLPPTDYSDTPYLEWFSEENGRVAIELDADQVQVIGKPIPACESDPISRQEQARNMANFLSSLSTEAQVPAVVVGGNSPIVSDPAFTHWVVTEGHIIGEACDVEPEKNGTCFAYVRLFNMSECAEHGTIERKHLRQKSDGLPNDAAAADGFTEEVQP